MPEYMIYPSHKTAPTPEFLIQELHKRGWDVELNLKGGNRSWESARFFLEGPPEIECFVINDSNFHRFHISLPEDHPPKALDLQMHVVDVLLKNLGGDAEDMTSHRRYNAPEFAAQMLFRSRPYLPFEWKTLRWPLFAWLTTGFALGVILFGNPEARIPAILLSVVSLLSALGLTFYIKKND